MSKFIQIAISSGPSQASSFLFALDDEGTIWVRPLLRPPQADCEYPFYIFARSQTETPTEPSVDTDLNDEHF